jgi:hypothetical protein
MLFQEKRSGFLFKKMKEGNMGSKLKLSLILVTLIVSFVFSAGDVRAEDPIVGCWDMSGTIKATAKVKGVSKSTRSSFYETVCFDDYGTFDDSTGYGTWVYAQKKYKLTYGNMSDLQVALIDELRIYFDDVNAQFITAGWTLKLKKDQLKGSANIKGNGTLYYGKTYNFSFAVKITIKSSYQSSYYGSYGLGSVENAQSMIEVAPNESGGIMENIVNNVEHLIMNEAGK